MRICVLKDGYLRLFSLGMYAHLPGKYVLECSLRCAQSGNMPRVVSKSRILSNEQLLDLLGLLEDAGVAAIHHTYHHLQTGRCATHNQH